MVARWTHAALAFALAVIIGALGLASTDPERVVDGGTTDAIGAPRGSIQHAKRIERARVTSHAPRAVHAIPPPQGFELVEPDRRAEVVRTALVASCAPDAAPHASRARGPPA